MLLLILLPPSPPSLLSSLLDFRSSFRLSFLPFCHIFRLSVVLPAFLWSCIHFYPSRLSACHPFLPSSLFFFCFLPFFFRSDALLLTPNFTHPYSPSYSYRSGLTRYSRTARSTCPTSSSTSRDSKRKPTASRFRWEGGWLTMMLIWDLDFFWY